MSDSVAKAGIGDGGKTPDGTGISGPVTADGGKGTDGTGISGAPSKTASSETGSPAGASN
jgi:hypothetical protein